jgi:putative holliday junction resolvase
VIRVIGLDHGSRRIGVAVGDIETGMAFARPALRRRNLEADIRAVAGLAEEEEATLVVLGLPLNMDGTEGPQADAARSFGTALAGAGLNVAYEDERLTSWAAGEALREVGKRLPRATGELDSAAARLILQQYLDAHARATPDEVTE